MDLAWFPDGKHLLFMGATAGQAGRTYEMDIEGGKPKELGPADWQGVAMAKDGRRIAGYRVSGETVVFNRETQN